MIIGTCDALRGQRFDRARKILGRALGQDVTTRSHGEVHALEPRVLDGAAEVVPVELRAGAWRRGRTRAAICAASGRRASLADSSAA